MSREVPDVGLGARVHEAERRLRRDPRYGVVRPLVSTRSCGAVGSISTFTQYDRRFELRSDESVDRGGEGADPSPMRYLLSSAGFCAQVWLAKAAALAAVTLLDVRIDVRTLLDMRGEHRVGDIPPHPPWFVVQVSLSSPDPQEAVTAVAVESLARCPVTSLLARAVPVHLVVDHDGVRSHDDRSADVRRRDDEEEMT